MPENLTSDSTENGKVNIEQMFDGIANSYDFLNHFLSLGIDKYWRKITVKAILKNNPKHVLDIATGTADLAIATAKKSKEVRISGVDISEQMLIIGRAKVVKNKLTDRIEMLNASAMALPFKDNSFDVVSIGFGIRNFPDVDGSLKEIHRVIKENGQLCILEFSQPGNYLIRKLYYFYFSKILPFIGNRLSHHKYAYKYLNESASAFPSGEKFNEYLRRNGFENIKNNPLTFGISTLYISNKPSITK